MYIRVAESLLKLILISVTLSQTFGHDLTRNTNIVQPRQRWRPSDELASIHQNPLKEEPSRNNSSSKENDSSLPAVSRAHDIAKGPRNKVELNAGTQDKWMSLLQKNFDMLRKQERKSPSRTALTEGEEGVQMYPIQTNKRDLCCHLDIYCVECRKKRSISSI